MRDNLRQALLMPGFCFLLALMHCAGGGTDVENMVVEGVVIDSENPMPLAKVVLMPEMYNPMTRLPSEALETLTNDQGEFLFEGLVEGVYQLEVIHPEEDRMVWVKKVIPKSKGTAPLVLTTKSKKGIFIRLPDNAAEDAYIYCPGTNTFSLRERAGRVLEFFPVPDDSLFSIHLRSLSQDSLLQTFKVKVPAVSTDTIDLASNSSLMPLHWYTMKHELTFVALGS